MTIYFVTRHRGAVDWAREQGMAVDQMVTHLDTAAVAAGDVVIGSLPVNLAAEVCAKGARYFHLILDLPLEMRGKELTALDMNAVGARIQEFVVGAGIRG